MKDTEIHNGLENKEIRDFLSKSIVDAYDKAKLKSHPNIYDKGKPFEHALSNLKIQKDEIDIDIEKLEVLKSVDILSTKMEWDEYDISNSIIKSGYMCRNFFGTEIEFKAFCNKNNIEY